MKKRILGLMVGFLLIGVNLFAADGDLIVNGKVGIGTTNPLTKLHVYGGNIGAQQTAGNSTGYYIVSGDPGASANSYWHILAPFYGGPAGSFGIADARQVFKD